jgi:hypothetical protein
VAQRASMSLKLAWSGIIGKLLRTGWRAGCGAMPPIVPMRRSVRHPQFPGSAPRRLPAEAPARPAAHGTAACTGRSGTRHRRSPARWSVSLAQRMVSGLRHAARPRQWQQAVTCCHWAGRHCRLQQPSARPRPRPALPRRRDQPRPERPNVHRPSSACHAAVDTSGAPAIAAGCIAAPAARCTAVNGRLARRQPIRPERHAAASRSGRAAARECCMSMSNTRLSSCALFIKRLAPNLPLASDG